MSRKRKAKEAQQKRLREKALKEADLQGLAKPNLPPAFDNAVYQPYGSLVNLRGKDPQQLLQTGQLLVKLDRYAIVPLEQYQQMLDLLNKSQQVVRLYKEEQMAKGKKIAKEIINTPIVKAQKEKEISEAMSIAEEIIAGEKPTEIQQTQQTNFSF